MPCTKVNILIRTVSSSPPTNTNRSKRIKICWKKVLILYKVWNSHKYHKKRVKISKRFQWRQTTCNNHSLRAQIIFRRPKKHEKVKGQNKDNIQIKFAPKSRPLSIVQTINIMFRWQPLQQQLIPLSMVERSRYHWVRINKCSSFSPRMLNHKHPFCSTTSMTTVSHSITLRAVRLNVQIITCSIIRQIYGSVESLRVIGCLQDRTWLVEAGDGREEVPLRSNLTIPQVLWRIPMSLAGPENRRLFITSITKIKCINFIRNLASQRTTLNS